MGKLSIDSELCTEDIQNPTGVDEVGNGGKERGKVRAVDIHRGITAEKNLHFSSILYS